MNYVRNNKFKILIVDDEINIIQFLRMGLESQGYEIFEATDGNAALSLVTDLQPHLVILDIMLPGMDGYEVCSEIKKICNIPIIMVTAKDSIDDLVKGLNIGADDYIYKPFSFKELLARINARLRISYPETTTALIIGTFEINDDAHEIKYKGETLNLPPTQYNLLKYLLINKGMVLSKSQILETVWGYDFNGEDNIVEVYIKYLRDKLGDKNHTIIKTIRGIGYKVVI